jgi:hypothetical protein
VSASSDGRIALIDLRKLLTPTRSSKGLHVKSFDASAIEPPQRMLPLDVISSPSPLVQIGLYVRVRMVLLESGTSLKHWRLRGGHRL